MYYYACHCVSRAHVIVVLDQATCVTMYTNTATGLAPDEVQFDRGIVSAICVYVRDHLINCCIVLHSALCANSNMSVGRGMHPTGNSKWRLRPETVESLFYMWRLTGNGIFREWGWTIFQAIEKYCKVGAWHACVHQYLCCVIMRHYVLCALCCHSCLPCIWLLPVSISQVANGYSGIQNVNDVNSAKHDTMESFWLAETLKYLFLLFSPDSALNLSEFVFNTEAHPLRIMRDFSLHDTVDVKAVAEQWKRDTLLLELARKGVSPP